MSVDAVKTLMGQPRVKQLQVPLITVGSYLQMVESGEVRLPEYRRVKKWDERMKVQYVESVVRGLGVLSLIVVGRTAGGRYVVIDGFNRTTALLEFRRGQLRAFGRLIDEDPALRSRFESAQLLVCFVTVEDIKDLVDIFLIVNAMSARPSFTDFLFAYKQVSPQLQLIDEFAAWIVAKARELGVKIRDPRMYALLALYYSVRRLPTFSYRKLVRLVNVDTEELMRHIEELKRLFETHGLPKATELKRFVASEPESPEVKLWLMICDARFAPSQQVSIPLARLRKVASLREVRRVAEVLERAGICRREGRRLVCKTAALREHCNTNVT